MSRNARHLPPRISFAPDGLVKRQRCLQRGGASKPEIISRNPATVIIENNREPGLGGFALLVQNKDGQERVISLPAFIGSVCLVTIDQIKLLSVDLRSLVRADTYTEVRKKERTGRDERLPRRSECTSIPAIKSAIPEVDRFYGRGSHQNGQGCARAASR